MDTIQADLSNALVHFNQGRYEASNAVLARLAPDAEHRSFVDFCVARNHLHQNDPTRAEVWFKRSLAASDPFLWSYYEMARLRFNAGTLAEACHHLIDFCEASIAQSMVSDLNATHLRFIVDVAHLSFDGEHSREGAARLYRLISALAFRNYLCELRIIETGLDDGRLSEATVQMTRLRETFQLDAWGFLVSSRLEFARGEKELALDAILQAVQADPSSALIKVKAANAMLSSELVAEAASFTRYVLAPISHTDPALADEIAGIEFRLAVHRRDHAWILARCRADSFLEHIPNWLCVEALDRFAQPGYLSKPLDADVAILLETFLESRLPYSLGTVLGLLRSYSTRRLWAKVGRLEDLIRTDDLFEHHAVVLRRFESSCSALKLDYAEALYSRHYSHGELRQWECCGVLRYLAQIRAWSEVEKLLFYFLSQRYHIPDGTPFLLKLCRRLNCHAGVMQVIDKIPIRHRPSQYVDLLTLLRDDLIVRSSGNGRWPTPDQTVKISQESSAFVKRGHSGTPMDTAVVGVLCTDKAYCFSVFAFLASVATHMSGDSRLTWFLFLAPDVPATWSGILQDFATKIGLEVQVIPHDDFVSNEFSHSEDYGIFTGGNTLSSAAFLRMYAVAYLSRMDWVRKAIYVDCDIVCCGDLSPLLAVPFEGALLLARSEEASPEIDEVTRRHNLAPGSYFNSGVLVFDLADIDAGRLIGQAVRLAESESSSLVFHDQCALNIAFAGRTRFLDPLCNFFVRANRPDNGDSAKALLLHFLDQPKPWNLAYKGDGRAIWWRYAGTVRVLLDASDYNALVAAAN